MYADIEWYSKTRDKMASIAINGGSVTYDSVRSGKKPVPEDMRTAVLGLIHQLQDGLDRVFEDDLNLQVRS